ncbi:MAG: hypothetical protein H6Q05_1616 [Acidobacteria bacterium]|nr:hypothetical protein [Acidobacteriota bacterium]
MPLFMLGGQRFALRDSRPGAAFPPLPDVNGGRRRPRAGMGSLCGLRSLCGSFLFFLTSIQSEILSGRMTLCILFDGDPQPDFDIDSEDPSLPIAQSDVTYRLPGRQSL